MKFTEEHDLVRKTVLDFVAREINSCVDEWERADLFTAC